uniref:Uncharacterized protein n=1 Tax=Erwinia amylovora ATCC BAA-2158 TaxID=889211 RepID=E5B0Q5_ERWAM|nr:hypothetical protein predicted by Glimmer/Critica [Erwinia amylovora ATCC BAA-2158]
MICDGIGATWHQWWFCVGEEIQSWGKKTDMPKVVSVHG